MDSICIVMALYQPEQEFLDAQIASLARQTIPCHVVFVEADGKAGRSAMELAEKHGIAAHLYCAPTPLDAPRAFEAGLREALGHFPEAAFFALSDQDDIWREDRLEAGLTKLEESGAALVHSDASVIDARGELLAPSLFKLERRAARDTFRGLLYRNTVTGMTLLTRRAVVEAALPFPAQDGVHFYHDLWLALVAQCQGGIARVKAPLVAYRQHGGNAVGAVPQAPRATLRAYAGAYALARYLAVTVRLRFGDQRALRPFWRTRTLGMGFAADALWAALRGRWGEAKLATAFFGASCGRVFMAARQIGHALCPASWRAAMSGIDARLYQLAPGPAPAALPSPEAEPKDQPKAEPAVAWWTYFDGRMAAKWVPDFSAAEPSINVLIPSLNPTEIFAGVATAIDLGLELASHGHAVRFIAGDLPMASPSASRAFVAGRVRYADVMARVSLHCGVTQKTLPAHPADRFVATAWWSAHVAHRLIEAHGYHQSAFAYLIQDYEPCFYPWGTEHAGALASYDLPCLPVFNTTTLRDHTLAQGHNFIEPALTFRPAIDTAAYAALPRAGRPRRRIVVYGRPEVPRNLFPLAVEGLGRFIEAAGLDKNDVEVVSLGLRHRNVLLPGGIEMVSLGKLPWADYPSYLAESDIGLSLMMSPHPSHPPIEMAAAGMQVVTNGFGQKDLSILAPQIASAPMTAEGLAAAIGSAWTADMPSALERQIDLSPLGAPLAEVAEALADRLNPSRSAKPSAQAAA